EAVPALEPLDGLDQRAGVDAVRGQLRVASQVSDALKARGQLRRTLPGLAGLDLLAGTERGYQGRLVTAGGGLVVCERPAGTRVVGERRLAFGQRRREVPALAEV